MTDRQSPEDGALTGATGDLTPDDTDRAFTPGERREAEDPDARARVTAHQGLRAPSQLGEVGDPGGELAEGGPTNMATRESGYGSEHGLSPDDPAYRMEVHPPAPPASAPAEEGRTDIGGDEASDREERY